MKPIRTRAVAGFAVLQLVAVLAACSESATAPRDGAGLLEARDLLGVRDHWSGYTEPMQMVVTDAARWAAEWATIHGHFVEPPPVPTVDFASSVVVIAAMGSRPTGGYSIEIEEVRAAGGALHVKVLERSPGSSCGTAQALTSPVHAVEVPRHGTTASFAIRRETFSC